MLQLPGLEASPQEPVARATAPAGALQELFGFDAFRPGQQEAVDAALAGRDVLVVMPTGAGKSLCYQLPALMRADLTVVVSPLVSLMQDQVEALQRVAPGRVALVNGQQDSRINRQAIEAAARGDLRLLYVAPERFASPGFVQALGAARIGRFVVDEAHCVSQWGHDFRPDYFRLAAVARSLGVESIVASTATATPQVAADVVERLGLRDPARVLTGFDRPNLSFAVVPVPAKVAAHRAIEAALAEPGALPAIVYAGTRADCEKLAARLTRSLDVPVPAYHAGLPRDARARVQRSFMRGDAPVVVATNAFGMGVDKADVRTVCHEAVPVSLEAYYQEAGRAGRDGKPARALLFAAQKDKGLHAFFIERATVEEGQVAAVAQALERAGSPFDVGLVDLERAMGGGPADGDRVRGIVGHLQRAGVLVPAPAPPDRVAGTLLAPYDGAARRVVRAAAEEATKVRWGQYRAIWDWVQASSCRRAGILAHFGDPERVHTDPGVLCCDVCDAGALPAPPREDGRRAGGAPRQLAHVPLTAAGSARALDAAIVALIESADEPMGRNRCVEVLRGGRSAELRRRGYDGLPAYGTYGHLKAVAVLARVDALLEAGTLRQTLGRFPKLVLA